MEKFFLWSLIIFNKITHFESFHSPPDLNLNSTIPCANSYFLSLHYKARKRQPGTPLLSFYNLLLLCLVLVSQYQSGKLLLREAHGCWLVEPTFIKQCNLHQLASSNYELEWAIAVTSSLKSQTLVRVFWEPKSLGIPKSFFFVLEICTE